MFARRDQARDVTALFTVRIDGTNARRLTPWKLDGLNRPDWSVDGRWIVLHKPSSTGQTQPFLIHPNGRGLTKVTHTSDFSWTWSEFSPDGRWITAIRSPGTSGENDVYVMTLQGDHLHNVTEAASSKLTEGLPDWGSR